MACHTYHHSNLHLMPQDHGAAGHGFGHRGFRSHGTHSLLSHQGTLAYTNGLCSMGRQLERPPYLLQMRQSGVRVAAINARTSKVKHLMHLIRCLSFVEARLHLRLSSTYISTHANHLADSLPRNMLSSFLSKPTPTPIQHHSPIHCGASCSTFKRTGPRPPGRISSTLFSSGPSTIYADNSHKTISQLLHTLPNPFPVSESLLCAFVAFLADEGMAPQTCKSYLVAVSNIQLSLSLPDPREHSSLPILKRVQDAEW